MTKIESETQTENKKLKLMLKTVLAATKLFERFKIFLKRSQQRFKTF